MLFGTFSLIFERPEEEPRGLEIAKWHPTAFCGAEIFSNGVEIFSCEAEFFLNDKKVVLSCLSCLLPLRRGLAKDNLDNLGQLFYLFQFIVLLLRTTF